MTMTDHPASDSPVATLPDPKDLPAGLIEKAPKAQRPAPQIPGGSATPTIGDRRFDRYELVDAQSGEILSHYLRSEPWPGAQAGEPCIYIGAKERDLGIKALVEGGRDQKTILARRVPAGCVNRIH